MKKMRDMRLEEGFSQAELARKTRMNQTHISEIERNVRQPWPKARRSIARVLGVHPHELWPDLEKGGSGKK